MHLVQTMAYANEEPWHGLGNKLAPNQPLEVWARQAGMEWRIESADVRFVAPGGGGAPAVRVCPDRRVLYRSDTQTPMSVVSSQFQVVERLLDRSPLYQRA